jgi:two-component system response regulator
MQRDFIVMIEDSQDDVELTLRSFAKYNMANTVVVLKDGAEALDYFLCRGNFSAKDKSELPAVVILDIKLPKVDGLEVLKQLRANPSTKLIPVVILTSSKEEQDVINGYKNGCNSYVRKPVDFEKFSQAVSEMGKYWLMLNEKIPPHQ